MNKMSSDMRSVPDLTSTNVQKLMWSWIRHCRRNC